MLLIIKKSCEYIQIHTYSSLDGKLLTFFGHARESNLGPVQTLILTKEIFPSIWGKNSGKFFPLYGFAPDPFPTFGEKFPQIFYQCACLLIEGTLII